jgi:hypothetical protein
LGRCSTSISAVQNRVARSGSFLLEDDAGMSGQLQYEDVERYLRTCSTVEPADHFGGLLRLVLAGIENLRESVVEGDIRENAHLMTDAQAGFLRELLDGRAESTAWFKDDVSHSSRTGQL